MLGAARLMSWRINAWSTGKKWSCKIINNRNDVRKNTVKTSIRCAFEIFNILYKIKPVALTSSLKNNLTE